MNPTQLREQIELEIVELIQAKLNSGELTEARAKAMAEHALAVLRVGMTFEELYKAIPTLDDTMTEFSPIVLPHLRDYETNVTSQALINVQDLIKQGQFDAATKLAKQATTRDVELVWQGAGKINDN